MTPFIIVGVPRTGSTLLLTGLRQHPDIEAYSELLHPSAEQRQTSHAIERGGSILSFQSGDPLHFLKETVYDFPLGKKAAGFKLLSLHVEHPNLYERLREGISGLHVIHITRPNYLDSLVSWKMAHATGQWYRSNGAGQKHQPIAISPDEADRYFRETEAIDGWLARYFRGPRYLKVTYDKLAANYPRQMAGVFRFLGVDSRPLQTMLQKQIERSPQDIVTNFNELSSHFAGTPFSRFFRQPTALGRLFGSLTRFG